MCVLAGSSCIGIGGGGGVACRSGAAGGSQKPPPIGTPWGMTVGLGSSEGYPGWLPACEKVPLRLFVGP